MAEPGATDADQDEQQQQEEQEQQKAAAAAEAAAAGSGDDVAAPSPCAASGGGKQQDGSGLLLPLARVKKMMKETADVKIVSADAGFVVARAAELFLGELAGRSHAALQADGQQRKALDYKDVAAVVHGWDAADFLRPVVPQKVKLADVMEQLKQQQAELQPRCLADD